MPFLSASIRRQSLFSPVCIKRVFQRYSISCIVLQRPSSRSARHSAKAFRPNGITGTQTRYLKAFSSLGETIPLSPAQKETIYALSTPPGRAGIAVIRISGPKVPQIYHRVVKPISKGSISLIKHERRGDEGVSSATMLPEPWKMHRCSVIDPGAKQVLDEGLAVYFAAPKSFTGEDVLELHIHSGRAIITAVLSALSKLPACRMAEPGEFTRRAFEKGRLDLTQVEGLKDLIDAETEEQRRWALSAAHGTVRDEVELLRKEIIACLVLCEAEIDFGDTEEIDEGLVQKAKEHALALIQKLQTHLQDSRRGEIMRTGVRIVIFGEPNAGKSSLLNWLAKRQAAIVTSLPGTTRDVVEVSLDLGGLPVIVCDTAGLRDTHDPVERIGVEKAGDAVRQADIALCVVSIEELERRHNIARIPHELPVANVWGTEMEPLLTPETLVLLNKIDLAKESSIWHAQVMEKVSSEVLARHEDATEWWWPISLTTGAGMQEFVQGLVEAIKQRYGIEPGGRASGSGSREPMIRHGRQRMHMENAVKYLEAFVRCVQGDEGVSVDVVLGAEELRYAAKEIGSISRAVSVDDILDSLFHDFCIGKLWPYLTLAADHPFFDSPSFTQMGVLQTFFNQPSRSYASTESGTPPAPIVTPNVDNVSQERAARRSNYYSAAADPVLRKEWDRVLQQDSRPRTRRPISAGAGHTQIYTNSGQRPASQPLQPPNRLPKLPVNHIKDEEEKEEFFTPFTSPQASPQTASLDIGTHSTVPMQSLNMLAEQQHKEKRPLLGTSSLNPSSTSSIASTSEDNYTNYSWSDGRASEVTSITRVSSRTSRHSKQRSESSVNLTAPAADWGNEIRWLVPPESSNPTPKRSHTISAPSTTSLSSSRSHTSSRSSSERSGSRSGRSKTEPVRPRPKRRMSEIQEEAEDDVARSSQDEAQLSKQPLVTAFGVLTPQRRKSQSDRTRPRPRKGSLTTHSEASSTSSTPTANLPILVPHAEPTTYTSLVFPRAGYQPSKHPERLTNSVDIVQSGVASTTMSTISVTKHAAEHLTRSRKFSFPTKLTSPRNSTETPSHLTVNSTSIVSLTSHTPTPSKVQTNQVLVKVWCVALEGLDILLAREKSKNVDGYRFVPGRGFCGRVVEVGYSVSNLRKGDWVMGLLDVAKSGALSEFLVVEKRRVARCPSPTASLTAEHLAVLAVSGVAAYRATNTLPGPLKDSRILVLQAHDGTGALVAQQLVAGGARVTVQIDSADFIEKLRGLKLEAVKIGAPLAVLRALGEMDEGGLGAFDAVVDTVGGKEIWESCKVVFGSTGQFTTVVGDSADAVMSRNAHVKSNMRSLKRAFTKSDNRFIGYEWVSPSNEVDHEGKDIRDSLASACALATEGLVRPRIAEDLIVPFERAPDILNDSRPDGAASSLLQGAVAVIRLQ